MTSLGWECTAFALRLGASVSSIIAIVGAVLVFALQGFGWHVVAVSVGGAIVAAVLIVLEDRAKWRARAELRRETGARR